MRPLQAFKCAQHYRNLAVNCNSRPRTHPWAQRRPWGLQYGHRPLSVYTRGAAPSLRSVTKAYRLQWASIQAMPQSPTQRTTSRRRALRLNALRDQTTNMVKPWKVINFTSPYDLRTLKHFTIYASQRWLLPRAHRPPAPPRPTTWLGKDGAGIARP